MVFRGPFEDQSRTSSGPLSPQAKEDWTKTDRSWTRRIHAPENKVEVLSTCFRGSAVRLWGHILVSTSTANIACLSSPSRVKSLAVSRLDIILSV